MNQTTLKKIQDDPQMEIAALRKQLSVQETTIKKFRTALGDDKRFLDQIRTAVVASPPFKAKYEVDRSRSKPRVTAVIKFSDWHIGEFVSRAETTGFGGYDWEIAQRRIFQIVTDFIRWIKTMRSAYIIEDVEIFCEGDYVSGDIHLELLVTNEFPLPVQATKAGLLLGEIIRMIAGEFKQIRVQCVGGDNHGRLVKKPQAKQKATNSMNVPVYALAQAKLEQCNNVYFNIAEGAKLDVEVQGTKFLLEHGDSVKGWSGHPFYGFQRMLGKEAMRRMNTNKGFHYWSIGHWHVPNVIENVTFVNGSLSGTSEFDHIQGRHSSPCQVAFLVHSEHRVFNWVPFSGI